MSNQRLAALGIVITTASMVHAQAPAGNGVITGVVRDERGQPLEGVRVSAAYRAKQWNGPYRATAIGKPDQTDDRGMFRLHSLPAGTFIVSVMPERPTGRAYVAYYPSTFEMSEAGVVTVEGGREADVAIVMRPVQELQVSGVVRERDGTPAAAMDVVLVPESQDTPLWTGPGVYSTRTGADGAFTMRARPGRYTVIARRLNTPGPRESAEQELTISSEPVPALALRTSLPTTVSGRLVWEGIEAQPWPVKGSLGGVRAVRVNANYPMSAVSDFRLSGDGTFSFEGLRGLVRFEETGLRTGWRTLRVEGPVAGPSSHRLLFQPGADISDLRIVLTNRVGWMVPAVRDGDQPVTRASVAILPETPTADTRNGSGIVEMTTPGLTVTDLLEGTYLVVALDIPAGYLLQDTALMEQARAAATRVTVQVRASTNVTLPLTRLRATAERLCACRLEWLDTGRGPRP